MTDTTIADALIAVREHSERSWYCFTGQYGFKAIVPDWRVGSTPDGSPCLSVEVVGPGAANALRRFARDYYLVLGHDGDQRPQFDIHQPGRTVLAWRHRGVWVELWHPDGAAAPAPATDGRSGRRAFLGPGGRFNFTRRKKENTTS